MSSRQAVVLASRVLCVFLLYSACADLTYLPQHILNTVHQWQVMSTGSAHEFDRYWVRYFSLGLEAVVTRIVIALSFAGVFYRCGDRIAGFLLGDRAPSSSVPDSNI